MDMATETEIEKAIFAKEKEVAELRHKLEISEAELRGMKAISAHLSRAKNITTREFHVSEPKPLNEAAGYRGGRQPGSISKTWRDILSYLYWKNKKPGDFFNLQDVIRTALSFGITIRLSDAHSRMKHYMVLNFINEDGHDQYRVTSFAAKKFGFDSAPLANAVENEDIDVSSMVEENPSIFE